MTGQTRYRGRSGSHVLGRCPDQRKGWIMTDYVFVYRAPKGYRGTPEGFAAYNAWFDCLGDHLVDKGNPVFTRTATGTTTPGTDTVLGGYSLIRAENLDEAAELAKGCPIVAAGGGVEVGELIPVPGREHPARIY
jgi:YCII-related domain-containing protein